MELKKTETLKLQPQMHLFTFSAQKGPQGVSGFISCSVEHHCEEQETHYRKDLPCAALLLLVSAHHKIKNPNS